MSFFEIELGSFTGMFFLYYDRIPYKVLKIEINRYDS